MDTTDIQIPVSKKKLLLIIIGSILFVLASVWLVFFLDGERITRFNPILIKAVGIIGILFFGMACVPAIQKIIKDKIGLIINNEGIIDNSNAIDIGLIKWEDITHVQTAKVSSTKFIMIFVSNPEEYIERSSSKIKRKMMQTNYKNWGSPLSISSTSLQCSFTELENIIQEGLEKHKTNHSTNS